MSLDFQDTVPMALGAPPEEVLPPQRTLHRLSFHGSGGEYFRIWVVNLALSVLTLGIYSPWAKVRAQRYFHANTELDGSRFEYHAKPLNILLGRGMLALIFITGMALAQNLNPLFLVVLTVGLALLPWLIASSMRFKARIVSWRGVRFAWMGSTASVYLRLLKVTFLTIITFGIYYFAASHSLKRLFIDKLQFGDKEFECQSTAGSFFAPYFSFGLVVTVGNKILEATELHLDKLSELGIFQVAMSVLGIGISFVAYQVLECMLSKIVQNATTLGSLQLINEVEFTEVLSLYIVNFIFMVLTLGLYWPWARIRAMQYRADHFLVVGNLEAMQSHNIAAQNTGAFGQEAAGVLDFDVSF